MTGKIPQEWQEALIQPIHNKGDPKSIANYRPISLTENLRKLYERSLQGTITNAINQSLHKSQGGFRQKRSTIDQIASLNEEILQRSRKLGGRWPVTAYLDIKAAYDTVHRPTLWKTLREKGLKGRLLRNLTWITTNPKSHYWAKSPGL